MRSITVREEGVMGEFVTPEGSGTFPGAVCLSGSDGGLPMYLVELLVPFGIACLAIAYWNFDGLPSALCEIPVERVAAAAGWLRNRPEVQAPDGRVGLIGGSKGGELALVAAATFPELIGPVVALVPGGVVWAGIDMSMASEAMRRSSWSCGGSPLPFVPYPEGVIPEFTAAGMRLRSIYEAGLEQHDAVEAAAIPVERAGGPILLISGGQDGCWPSTRMSRMVLERMERYGRGHLVRHIDFAECGHAVFRPPASFPVPPIPFDMGGTPEAIDAVHDASVAEIVRHLGGTEPDSAPNTS